MTLEISGTPPIQSIPGWAAIDAIQFITRVNTATLSNERALAGTVNQINLADGGAGAALTLSLPQDYDIAATPRLGGLGLGVAGVAGAIALADSTWIGLGAAAGRIGFDDLATDTISFHDSRALFSDGTELLPGQSWISDPDTGRYHVGADAMADVCGGSAVVHLTPTGLGVGITPTRSLTLDGTLLVTGTQDANWTTAGWGKRIELKTAGGIQWLKAGAGTISRGIMFTVDDKMSFVRSTANDASAVAITDLVLTGDGSVGINTITPDRLFHAEVVNAGTNSVTYAQRLSHVSSATVLTGFGTGIEFELEENDGSNRVAGAIDAVWTDAGEGVNADCDFIFKLMQNDGAVASKVRFSSNGGVSIGDYWSTQQPPVTGLLLEGYLGVGGLPATQLELNEEITLTGATGDGYAAAATLDPAYSGAFALTRHNYIDLNDPAVAGGATVTNAAVFRFDNTIGNHAALAAAFTTTDNNGDTTNWAGGVIVNINGVLYKMPLIAL